MYIFLCSCSVPSIIPAEWFTVLRQAMHATILFARASMPGRQATAVKIAADTSRSAFSCHRSWCSSGFTYFYVVREGLFFATVIRDRPRISQLPFREFSFLVIPPPPPLELPAPILWPGAIPGDPESVQIVSGHIADASQTPNIQEP